GGQQGDGDGQGHLAQVDAEEVALAEQVRGEDDDAGQGAGADRQLHAAGALDGAAHRVVRVLLPVLVDALHHHHGVVHQHADADQHAHHGQDVQGHAEEVHSAQGHHDADRDGQGHHQRRRPVAQEVEQDQQRQQRADQARLHQLGDGTLDAVGLVIDDVELDVTELRLGIDLPQLGHHHPGNVHQVGVALAEDVDTHRWAAVQAPAVVDLLALEANPGDVRQAQAVPIEHQVAQLVEVGDLADRLHAQTLPALVDLTGRDGEIDRAQPAGQLVQAQAVRGQAVRIDGDLDLGWGGAGDVDPGHAGQALEAPLEGLLDQRILVAEVAVAGE